MKAKYIDGDFVFDPDTPDRFFYLINKECAQWAIDNGVLVETETTKIADGKKVTIYNNIWGVIDE